MPFTSVAGKRAVRGAAVSLVAVASAIGVLGTAPAASAAVPSGVTTADITLKRGITTASGLTGGAFDRSLAASFLKRA